jgi:predicted Fe-Mo cluster-binding NifX family protein
MRIAISSTGPDLDAEVDPRFGRCQCFVVVDPATEELEVLDNEAAMMSGGAGIQAAQMVANSGVDAVITGNLGPNAADTLAATGLKVYLVVAGTVRQALQQYIEGQLQEATGPSVDANFGTTTPGGGTGMGGGRGMGMGGGEGMGRGMGRGMGMGRGKGRGMGMGRGMGRGYSSDPQVTPANDLEELKIQKDKLQEQMKRIEERISKLEKKK